MVIPVKRSNIIKNLSNDIEVLKNLVDDLIVKDNNLKSLCKQRGIRVDGLVNVENCKRDDDFKECQHTSSPKQTHSDLQTTQNEDVHVRETPVPNKTTPLSSLPLSSSNDQIFHSINNILSNFENVITPPNSNLISPNLSDVEDTKLDAHSYKLYSLNDFCCFSYDEINRIITNFNDNYLPFLPIFEKIVSIDKLFSSNKLLFWSIVYIVSGNVDIYNKFIIKEILQFVNNQDMDIDESKSYNSIVSILLLSCFPTKIKSTKFDMDDDLDTSIFQWLDVCKSNCLKFNFIEKYIDDNELNNYKKNIWCAIYILGNFYGFRLGLNWNQPLDFVLEESKDKSSYLGQLLNLTILLSKVLDRFNSNNSIDFKSNDHLLIKSLSNWKFKLNRIKNSPHLNLSNTENNVLKSNIKISIDFLDLIFTLFNPSDNLNLVLNICNNFFNSIKGLDVLKCPIFVKISLEFVCLVLTKLFYSPYFLNQPNIDMNLISDLYINLFNKLISFIEFNDTKFVFNTIMDFDSTVKIDSSLINIFNSKNNFHFQSLPDLIKDLKKLNQKFKSIELTNQRVMKNEKIFHSHNLNYELYSKQFNTFRNRVDLVIIYSNEILKLPNSENTDFKNPSMTSSSLPNSLSSSPSSIYSSSLQSNMNPILPDMKDKSDLQLQQQIDDLDLFGNFNNWIS